MEWLATESPAAFLRTKPSPIALQLDEGEASRLHLMNPGGDFFQVGTASPIEMGLAATLFA